MKQRYIRDDVLRQGLNSVSNDVVPPHNAALIGMGLDAIAQQWDLRIQESFDNLDYVRLAVVELPGGEGSAALLEHRGGPAQQTEIWLPALSRSLLRLIKLGLGLADEAVLWESPALQS